MSAPNSHWIDDEKRLALQSMPDDLMALTKDQFGEHFLQFEVWVGQVIDAAFEAGKAQQDRPLERTYLEGIEDAAAYLKGSTFSVNSLPVVNACLALLDGFREQGGFSKWPRQPQPEAGADGAAVMREALEKIEDFANGYSDVGGICYKIARDALRKVDGRQSATNWPAAEHK